MKTVEPASSPKDILALLEKAGEDGIALRALGRGVEGALHKLCKRRGYRLHVKRGESGATLRLESEQPQELYARLEGLRGDETLTVKRLSDRTFAALQCMAWRRGMKIARVNDERFVMLAIRPMRGTPAESPANPSRAIMPEPLTEGAECERFIMAFERYCNAKRIRGFPTLSEIVGLVKRLGYTRTWAGDLEGFIRGT